MQEPKEAECKFFDSINGVDITVDKSSLRCPETQQKLLKPVYVLQAIAVILFLFISILYGLSISIAVNDMQSDLPHSSYGTDVSVIVFGTISLVLLFILMGFIGNFFRKFYQIQYGFFE
jgi:hypothetical protein